MRKLLIVDDEREIRESLEEFFQEEGFAVTTAANGAEALARLAEEAPCVVLLDLLMPVVSGNEVYRAMQQEPRLTNVPVIVMTSDPSRAPSGLLIMKKPMNLSRLLSTVQQHCPDCPGP
jgi:two-component system, chemotaxis family, chemotaxis protein CheY